MKKVRYEEPVYRPPGEWRSFLLQATIGCSHNACTFCGMYKDKKFRIRPLDEILRDIEETSRTFDGFEKIFICDGDAIAIPTQDLVSILDSLKRHFPKARLISTYAGPKSTLHKSPEELAHLNHAGLGRAYLGIESGDDQVLRDTCKGVDARQMLQAGTAFLQAGIDLWGIILIGLGGTAGSREHILNTARLLNQMKPNHISAMTYTPVPGTRLYEDVRSGKFQVLTPVQCLEETKLLLENLNLKGVHFASDHASNYLPLKGTIGEDTPRLIALLDKAMSGEAEMRSEHTRGL